MSVGIIESRPIEIDETQPEWCRARVAYFAGAALRHKDAWQMHHDNGQFDVLLAAVGEETREIRAKPSIQHCMVEAARARVIGGLLGLSEDAIYTLEKAALLHDSFKGREVVMMLERGPSWESYDAAQAAARDSWERSGRFSTEVMDIAGSVAHESLLEMEEILAKPDEELTDFDKMCLAMHLIDDSTVEFYWATPADESGNDLDRRMTKNEHNERYTALNEEGRKYFGGRTAYEAQREIGHRVEDRLAGLIMAETGTTFNPRDLQVIMDNQIKLDITDIMLHQMTAEPAA